MHFAKEGADVVISYLNEHSDAEETKRQVEQEGRKCILIAGDIGVEAFCQDLINKTVEGLGKLDILINNAAEQHPQDKIEDITSEQLERTFRTNIFSMFYLTKAAMPHLKKVQQSLTQLRLRPTAVISSCWTIRPPKGRFSASPAPCR